MLCKTERISAAKSKRKAAALASNTAELSRTKNPEAGLSIKKYQQCQSWKIKNRMRTQPKSVSSALNREVVNFDHT